MTEILMCRRKGQLVDEGRVQDPEEVKQTVGMEVASLAFRDQWKGGAEELGVVAFVGCPNAGAVVEVFSEVDQNAGEFTKRLERQTERIVGEAALHFRERPPEFSGDLREM